MTATRMPKDANGVSIQSLSFKPNSGQEIAIGITSEINAVPFDVSTKIVSIWATHKCKINQGVNNQVEADENSVFIPAETWLDLSIWANELTHLPYIAVIRVNAIAGELYVSERV